MTTIDKLLITGIRSFSPQSKSVIEFYKPLTIIVGPNGAGKTTIIECLKYACTGDLPPNCKNGQAFIHDTKIAGEREVKAQIKLRFKNVNGKPFVCTRSLSLTQKASQQTMKAIESALQTVNAAGEKVSQSFRCVDIDKEIPELMGVSKAILENVIFVHQEDSNWPLMEGSALKKRFDDIFAATRYTKALEVIKKLRQDQTVLLKEYRLTLEHYKTLKENAEKLKEDLETQKSRMVEANEKISSLDADLAKCEAAIAKSKTISDSLKKFKNEIRELEATLREKKNSSAQLYEELPEEYEESLDELLKLDQTFQKEVASIQTQAEKIEHSITTLSQEINVLNTSTNDLSIVHAKSIAVQELHKQKVKELNELVANVAEENHIIGYSNPPLTAAKIRTFIEQISSLQSSKKRRN